MHMLFSIKQKREITIRFIIYVTPYRFDLVFCTKKNIMNVPVFVDDFINILFTANQLIVVIGNVTMITVHNLKIPDN